jgi:cell division protein FtsQ
LSGPLGTEGAVAQRYLAIQGRLAEGGVRLAALRLDARGAWEIDLENGVSVRLGRRDVDERFERFAEAALRLVAQRGAEIAYVDMRYSNGFATGWRNGTRVAAMDDGDETPEG